MENNKSENNTNTNVLQQLRSLNESNWKNLAEISESLDDKDKAIFCYENAINNNPSKIQILNKLASIYQEEDKYEEAIKYLKRIIQANSSDFDAWSNLGHCYLMMEDLKKAQSSYQQASQFPNSNNDPNLLYGIGILYARLNNLDYAQQLFEKVIQINETTNKFEKINELCFRLGIVHKQKGNYDEAMRYFQMIGDNPPVPLGIDDIKFQKGHIYELQKNITKAKEIYDEILLNNPTNAKVHQQIGWLYYHNPQLNPQSNTIAIKHLTDAINIDSTDAQTWYLLGRCQIANKEFNRAYEAYQQAVERDGTNPAFWCSIGVLFYQINQYNDALNAYTKAIELDPNFSEVWYDLGTLYESCHQIDDSLGAYQKASELDPSNIHIRQRLAYLRKKYENKDGNDMQDVSNGNYVENGNPNIPNNSYPVDNNGTVNNPQYIENNNSNGNINNNNVISNNNVNTNYHIDNINNTSFDKKRKLEKDTSGYNSKKLKDGDEAYNPNDDISESTESSESQPPNNTSQPYNSTSSDQLNPQNYYNQNLPQYPHTSDPNQYNSTNQQYGTDPQYNQTYPPQQSIYEPQVDPNATQQPSTYNPSYNNVLPSENTQYIYTPSTNPDPQQNQDSSNNVPPTSSEQVPPTSDSSSVTPSQPVNNVSPQNDTPPSTSTEVPPSNTVPVPSSDTNPPSDSHDSKVENKEPTTTTSPPPTTTTTASPEKNSSESSSNSVPPSDSQPEPPPTSSDPPTVKVEPENQN